MTIRKSIAKFLHNLADSVDPVKPLTPEQEQADYDKEIAAMWKKRRDDQREDERKFKEYNSSRPLTFP